MSKGDDVQSADVSPNSSIKNAKKGLGIWVVFCVWSLPAVAMEIWLYSQLAALESGTVESITVWWPVAQLYSAAGFWGAMSVWPGCIFLILLYTLMCYAPWVARVYAVLLLSVACLALLCVAAWVVYMPVREGEGVPAVVAAIGGFLALVGCGFGFLAWHTAREPADDIAKAKPARIDTFIEQNKWAKAAVAAAIIVIISAVMGMVIYFSTQ